MAFYFNGYFFYGVICALWQFYMAHTYCATSVHIKKIGSFSCIVTFFRKVSPPFYLQTGAVTEYVFFFWIQGNTPFSIEKRKMISAGCFSEE